MRRSFTVGWRQEVHRCPLGATPRWAWIAPGLQVWCEASDGKRNGPWTAWTPYGFKLIERRFRDGVSHGPASAWHINGRLASKGRFRNGRRDGLWIYWDRSGRKEREILYRAGRQLARRLF